MLEKLCEAFPPARACLEAAADGSGSVQLQKMAAFRGRLEGLAAITDEHDGDVSAELAEGAATQFWQHSNRWRQQSCNMDRTRMLTTRLSNKKIRGRTAKQGVSNQTHQASARSSSCRIENRSLTAPVLKAQMLASPGRGCWFRAVRALGRTTWRQRCCMPWKAFLCTPSACLLSCQTPPQGAVQTCPFHLSDTLQELKRSITGKSIITY